jgi:hypothetical protein
MELEQRVKTLEYEMKILKNEIQRTLLDIQEQVLVHYYPTLRTEETGPSDGVVRAIESVRAKQAKPNPESEFKAEQQAAANAVATSSVVPVSVVKKVSLDEIRSQQSGNGAAQPADHDQLANLVEWTTNSTAKFGGERVRRLIAASVAKGVIAPEAKAPMLQAARSGADDAPSSVAATDILKVFLKLDALLGREADVDEALELIEEAQLG